MRIVQRLSVNSLIDVISYLLIIQDFSGLCAILSCRLGKPEAFENADHRSDVPVLNPSHQSIKFTQLQC